MKRLKLTDFYDCMTEFEFSEESFKRRPRCLPDGLWRHAIDDSKVVPVEVGQTSPFDHVFPCPMHGPRERGGCFYSCMHHPFFNMPTQVVIDRLNEAAERLGFLEE